MRLLGQRRARVIEFVILLLILVSAAFLRLYQLDWLPPGLCLDEVMDGNLALDILGGRHGIYFPEAYGHETLFHYMQAASIGLLGHVTVAIRLPAALCGLGLIVLIWWLGRRLFGPAVGLIAAGGVAAGWWGVLYSRVGIRVISCPLLFAAAMIGWWGGLRLDGWKRWLAGGLGGLLTGLCLYTYPSSRVMVVLPLLLVLHQILFNRAVVRAHWRELVAFALIAALIGAPMAVYLSTHTEERAAQLAEPLERLKAGDAGPVLRLTVDTLLMPLGLKGDLRWLYNLSGRPIWGWPWAVLFLTGVGLSLWRFRQLEYAMLPLWLLLGLIPGMLTPDAPNTIRTLAAMPAAYLLAAAGGKEVVGWLANGKWQMANSKWQMAVCNLPFVILVLGHGLSTWRDLNRWGGEFEAQWRYQTPLFEAARALRQQSDDAPIYVSLPRDAELFVTSFELALNDPVQEWRWFVGDRALLFPAGGTPVRYLFTDGVTPDPTLVWAWLSEADLIESEQRRPDGQPFYRIYHLVAPDIHTLTQRGSGYIGEVGAPSADGAPSAHELPVDWVGAVTLQDYRWANDVWQPGGEAVLLTVWQAHAAQDRSLTLFVHLLDAQGQFVVGEDRLDVPAHTWQPGDVFVQVQRLVLPADLPPGRYWPEIGWYKRDDYARLPILQNGQPIADRLLLEAVEIEQ